MTSRRGTGESGTASLPVWRTYGADLGLAVPEHRGGGLIEGLGAAVISTLNVLGKPFRGSGRRLMAEEVAIKAVQRVVKRKSVLLIVKGRTVITL
ncbi:hypothetical protein DPMN_002779 [Dreissena polymorpha]|uniref:Uncharacterized protein n=1 Tax=Dreissena polymorpha TaxID=45954 RepID=A0A9D4RU78_DREPO|nr:hypothetical protein DPMN_002779 [Dreissena polymorpha]